MQTNNERSRQYAIRVIVKQLQSFHSRADIIEFEADKIAKGPLTDH